jgi:2-amino-4-hydroxy-6-hydroxymethyldihydropteridine diphosphokinase
VGRVNPVCVVALGSNVGDRRAHLDFAVSRLHELIDDLLVSDYIETDPVSIDGSALPQDHPRYLNAVAIGHPRVDPPHMLSGLLDIERARGRDRPSPGAPRTLDLDLILYDDVVLKEPGLEVPHPRFRDRAFVLEPLASLAPELRDPVSGRSVRELLKGLGTRD